MELSFFRYFMAYDEHQGLVDNFLIRERLFISDSILLRIYQMKYHLQQSGTGKGKYVEINDKFLKRVIVTISKDSLEHILKKRHELRRIMNFRKAMKN